MLRQNLYHFFNKSERVCSYPRYGHDFGLWRFVLGTFLGFEILLEFIEIPPVDSTLSKKS